MKKTLLITCGIIIVTAVVSIGVGYFQKKSFEAEQAKFYPMPGASVATSTTNSSLPIVGSNQKLASSMDDTETLRYLMTQVYNSEEFLSDDAEQLPNAWNENIKNRLLWKLSPQELVANPDWVEALNGYREDNAPKGYFIASPMLFHTYDNQGVTYASVFAQTATNGYSHVSGSNIGAGIFKKENDLWIPVFVSKNINEGIGASGDAGTLTPLSIGKNKYAYINELTNMAQGAIFYHKDIYFFDGTKFNNILSLMASGSDGTDCVNGGQENEWNGTIDISTKQTTNSDYFDLALNRGGTKPYGSDGGCRVIPIEKRIETYRWSGAKYELVK